MVDKSSETVTRTLKIYQIFMSAAITAALGLAGAIYRSVEASRNSDALQAQAIVRLEEQVGSIREGLVRADSLARMVQEHRVMIEINSQTIKALDESVRRLER